MYKCRICKSNCSFKWTLDVLNTKSNYYQCNNCNSLQLENPHWINNIYNNEKELSDKFDRGKFVRASSAYNYINILEKNGILNKTDVYFDFGSGENILKNKLKNSNYNALSYDPYYKNNDDIDNINNIKDNSINVIIAIEVLEHMFDIDNMYIFFNRVLANDKKIILSTLLYDYTKHNCNWDYLYPTIGQHVTFWSVESIKYFLRKLGFNILVFFPDNCGFLILGLIGNYDEIYNKITASSKDLNSIACNKDDFIGLKLLNINPMVIKL